MLRAQGTTRGESCAVPGMFAGMREIAPGIHHWTATHPKIAQDVSSYWLPEPALLLDPLAVPAAVDTVDTILLTNRHHLRDGVAASKRFGAPIRAPSSGMHEFSDRDPIEPYAPGDTLAGGAVRVHEIGSLSPDEMALHFPSLSALAVADTLIRYDEELAFVPDGLMDEPGETKRRLRETYARLVDELEFDHLLLAHGAPVVGGARERLRSFAQGG